MPFFFFCTRVAAAIGGAVAHHRTLPDLVFARHQPHFPQLFSAAISRSSGVLKKDCVVCQVKEYEVGETLVMEGKPAAEMFVIQSGLSPPTRPVVWRALSRCLFVSGTAAMWAMLEPAGSPDRIVSA